MTVAAHRSLVDLLEHRAAREGDALAYRFLDDGELREQTIRYRELAGRARAIAARLAASAAPGSRAVLLFPPGLDYVASFFGCLYAGMIPVPAYPPDPARLQRTLPRLQAIARDCGASVVLTSPAIAAMAPALAALAPDLLAMAWVAVDAATSEQGEPARPGADDVAFLQYTSGSTGNPKGVVLSHGNLMHNLSCIARCFGLHRGSIGVIWLPPYHDMGLIGGILAPLYVGFPTVLMSPLSFLQRPMRWLEAIARHGGTTSGGPNFAYDLCVRKSTAEERAALDLRTWDLAFVGAEPIRDGTLARFEEAFAPAGFRGTSYYPCYGLAEGTLIATGGDRHARPVVERFDAAGLAHGHGRPAAGEGGRALVGCGVSVPEQRLLIVDPERRVPLADGEIGEVWLAGPSVARGYLGRADESRATFEAALATGEGPFLRTGDLGFVRSGELFVTGRWKDLIIIRGRNLWASDIEAVVESAHPAVRPGCSAVVSVEGRGDEHLVVICEIARQPGASPDAIIEAIRAAVTSEHDVAVWAVALVAQGAIPKTTSGKIQRRAARSAFLDGALELVASWRADADSPSAAGGAPGEAAAQQAMAPAPLASPAAIARPAGARAPLAGGRAAFRALQGELAALIAGVLGVPADSIGPRTALGGLGLDSLRAVELQMAIEARHGCTVSLATLLGGLDLQGLVTEVLAAEPEIPVPDAMPGEPALPSHGQRALWFLHQLAPASTAYHIARAVRVRGGLVPEALRTALRGLVARHPALRATFPSAGHEPAMRVHEHAAFDFEVLDARALDDDALEGRVREVLDRPFDLERGPLFRVAVFERAHGEAVLALALHHINVDLWSFGVLVRELGVLYQAALHGQPAVLPPPSPGALELPRWQRAVLDSEQGARGLDYWSEVLGGSLPVLRLPTDRPRPAVQSFRGASVTQALDPALVTGLRGLARRLGVTPSTLVMSAYCALLHRWTGERDIVVGTPSAGRSRAAWADAMGYFVNALPIRVTVEPGMAFEALVAQVHERMLGALAHAHVPFGLLVERLQPARDPGRSPLFQTLFSWYGPDALRSDLHRFAVNGAGGRIAVATLDVEPFPVPRTAAQFDLTLAVVDMDDRALLCAEYCTDLFAADTMTALLRQQATLLESAVRDSLGAVGQLSLLSGAERERMVRAWNQTGRAWPEERLEQMFEAQAARTPEAVAVVCGGERWRYRELDERANQIGNHLKALGLAREARVGVLMERSAEAVAVMLGVMKAGGAYVPLDPAYPAERVSFTVRDAGMHVVVTRAGKHAALLPEGQAVLDMDRVSGELAAASRTRPDRDGAAGDLAYVIYTSGSTGVPKGVAIEHRCASNLVRWTREVYGEGELRGVLAGTSFCFDLSVYELFGTLCNGGTVHLVESVVEAGDALRSGEVTLINTVPSAMRELVQARQVPASVKTVNLAGEPLRRDLVDALYATGTVQRVYDLYGPSETTTYSTFVLRQAQGPETIGRPLASTEVYVLDEAGEPAPVGVVGEIYIGGAGVARGYLGRANQTAERFVPDRFSGRAGARLYRTGDLARYRADGTLELVGRRDHQVKVRGYRIELGEVEAALSGVAGVAEAVVVVRDERLVGYWAAASGTRVSEDALRAHLRARLPGYMVPAVLVELPALPRLPNGKIERGRLPAPAAGRAGARALPEGEGEERLARLFGEVLGVSDVGADESFFELGGHSLLATQVISRVRQELGVEVPLRALFEHATVRALAAYLAGEAATDRERAGGVTAEAGIPPAARTQPLPLSHAQERLWFLAQLAPDSASYNIPVAVRMSGKLNEAALEASLNEVVRRHEALRTTFATTADGQAVQQIAPALPLALETTDLGHLGGDAQQRAVAELARAEAQQPFDLAHGHLVRTRLVRLREDEHVWLLTMHHIVSDGWSMGVLVREIAALYQAHMDGRPADLPALPVQYADFALWQRRHLAGERLERALGYWTQKLAGAPDALDLPLDRPRPAVQSDRGGEVPVRIPAELTAALSALGRRHGATLFMTLLAGFQVLLARYSRQSDVVVGTPVANRNRAETENLIGFFVNTLALRANLDGDPSFEQLLAQVRDTTLEAYAHQDVPFERVVEALGVARNLGRTPVFQAVLALQNAPMPPMHLSGLELGIYPVPAETTKFDLTLRLIEQDGALSGAFEYSADLFDAATIESMAGALSTLLEAAVADATRAVSALPLLTPAAQRRITETWNATTAPYPRDRGVHALFAEVVHRSPGAPAVIAGDTVWTYAELQRHARRVARALHRQGVRPGDLVGICAERSAALMAAIVGILEAGGAYVPLDPEYPRQRLALMIEDVGIRVLVTQRAIAADLPTEGITIIHLEDVLAQVDEDPAGFLPARTRGDELAYVSFTSGSTGRPKGVAIPHRGVVRLVWNQDYISLRADDVVAQCSNISFDAATFEIWSALLHGGRLVVIPRDVLLSPAALGDAVKRHGITVILMIAGVFHQVVDAGLADFQGLRYLLAGGDVLSPVQVERARQALPTTRLVNAYGPTESTTVACCHPITEAVTATVPIGRPIRNTTVYILGPDLAPVPIGMPGELCIGGDGLARGYVARPSLTAERFVPDPFAATPGGRLYRTGDLARHRGDGTIEFLGRVDRQVKIRGFRIELGEIESALHGHRAVRDAAVIDWRDAAGARHLVAYVVLDRAASGESDALRSLPGDLASVLPGYMVPSLLIPVDALPLTPNGKLDRKALPDPRDHRSEVHDIGGVPRTALEQRLADTFRQVLAPVGVTWVGRADNFFELGGHSLLATQLVARLREQLGVEVPLRAVFEHQTVAALAAFIEDMRAWQPGLMDAPLATVTRQGELPLSFAQERLWFLAQLAPGSTAYHLPAVVRLRGRLDGAALRVALDAVVSRHEALRTTFPAVNGRPVQQIHASLPPDWQDVDLGAVAATEREVAMQALARALARRPFDLVRGPLVRAVLVRLSDEEHALCLGVHHIVFDGWSLRVLVREISEAYLAWTQDRPLARAALTVQPADWAAWQRQRLDGERLASEIAFWKQHLAGAPPALELPTDHARPAQWSGRGAELPLVIPAPLAERLEALGRGAGATLFMTLLAAFDVLLARYSGNSDVVVGTPVANRQHREIEGLIGFFVNTLAVRTSVAAVPPGILRFRDLLARVRQATLAAYEHQETPFEKVVEALAPARDLGRTPVIQVMFAYQDDAETTIRMDALEAEITHVPTESTQFDLTLSLARDGAQRERAIRGTLTYGSDLFTADTIARLGRGYLALLEAIAADPDAPVSMLPCMAPADRVHVLDVLSGAMVPAPALEAQVHEAILAHAAATPDAVAVVRGAEALSYGALARRAHGLARVLRARGVGPGTLVALLLEPSPDAVVAMLAVLEAGGAYVPLDPAYPARRIELVLRESRAGVAIASGERASALSDTVAVVIDIAGEPLATGTTPASAPADPPPPLAGPEDLAYVIFTSGSTGVPKGVAVTRANLAYSTRARSAVYERAPARFLLLSSLAFDSSVAGVFGTLARGGTLIVPEDDLRLGLDPIAHVVRRHQVTDLLCVPSLWAAILDHCRHQDLTSLGAVIVAGEACPAPLVEQHRRALPGVALYNEYGPTEATVWATVHRCADEAGARVVPIGRPIPGARVYVLDEHGQPAPMGARGHIHVGGPGVARGYLDRPVETAARFVPDPFAPGAGSRLYATGDVGRWTAGGLLEFTGRSDDQIKLRGYRIELGEIESVLGGHPQITAAAAAVHQGQSLVAYVVESSPGAIDPESLRAYLQARLPEHMVPGAVVLLDALPLLPNGKLDRGRLPDPRGARTLGRAEHVEPETETERRLAAIWRELLRLDQVGTRDSFFDLGGHSLLLVELQQRLQAVFGREVPVVELFRLPTIQALAAWLDGDQPHAASAVHEREIASGRARLLRQRARRSRDSD
jgi:amino acid adenylation domain-containing protein